MSPSEAKGMQLGIRLLSIDRRREAALLPSGQFNKTKLIVKFEAEHGKRRHYLTAHSKSRAGAWRAAVRWLRKIQKGEL